MSHAVDADITVARTLPASFYRDDASWARTRERVFARTWQWIGDLGDVARPCTLAPRELLPGLLDEPLLLARDAEGTLRCLSNVCTHRANLLVTAPCSAGQIRCGYHSRRFDLAGRMTFMPEFNDARHFPSEADHLAQVPLSSFGPLAFVALDPVAPLDAFVGEIRQRLAWLPLDRLVPDTSRNRDYPVAAHWALYVENYLEGLHVPFVHPALNEVIDYGSYTSELFRWANLQLAPARGDEPAFEPPRGSPDEGKRIAAYYFWVFPNLMLNFYPWGLSLNLVQPQGPDRCTVQFRSYVLDASLLRTGAGGALHEVEMEDEAVVQQVQRGVRSRFYRAGRYSPTRERGVHHFHRLLCEFLSEENDR
jgi:choline monooxygenase